MATCAKCHRSYAGLVCDCFAIRAAKEAAELQLRRFRDRQIQGYFYSGHVFLEATKTPALCGAEVKRTKDNMQSVSVDHMELAACKGCIAVAKPV